MPQARTEQNDTLETFTRDDLKRALSENEIAYSDHPSGGSLNLDLQGGLRANAALLACDEEGFEQNCFGTSILATFAKPSSASDKDVDAAITEYNYRQNFGRAYRDPEDGNISVRLYVIADGGITQTNYSRQIELWEASLGYFVGYLYNRDDTAET